NAGAFATGNPLFNITADSEVLTLLSKSTERFSRTMGKTLYELTNHLGNVNAVVSDRKIAVDSDSDNAIDFYEADVHSTTDYYPFGMSMVGRTFTPASGYRFGFGGQEMDNEISGNGNSYTAQFWQYDPRLGRRWNKDMITYPRQSTYAAFNNNPIYFADPLGLEGNGPDDPPKKVKHKMPSGSEEDVTQEDIDEYYSEENTETDFDTWYYNKYPNKKPKTVLDKVKNVWDATLQSIPDPDWSGNTTGELMGEGEKRDIKGHQLTDKGGGANANEGGPATKAEDPTGIPSISPDFAGGSMGKKGRGAYSSGNRVKTAGGASSKTDDGPVIHKNDNESIENQNSKQTIQTMNANEKAHEKPNDSIIIYVAVDSAIYYYRNPITGKPDSLPMRGDAYRHHYEHVKKKVYK
ncbi:MAG: hypothetical protein COA57_14385, partial [Flavobacteriales bacterium]